MNGVGLQSWSERQQVVAVILLAGVLIGALWFFALMPLNRRRAALETEIGGMREQLARKNYLLGEDALQKRKFDEEQVNHRLKTEWDATVRRVAAFPADEAVPRASSGVIIDYKVALFDVRHRLLKKSREMGISLPHTLGMDDAVAGNADARKLMLQLRTVEKLVDLALDLKIDMLRRIDPQDPVLHGWGSDESPFIEEYPVRLEFFGSRDDVYALLKAVLDPAHVFAVKEMRIESMPRMRAGILSVKAELSALVFLKGPEDMNLAVPDAPVRRGPVGI